MGNQVVYSGTRVGYQVRTVRHEWCSIIPVAVEVDETLYRESTTKKTNVENSHVSLQNYQVTQCCCGGEQTGWRDKWQPIAH